MRRDEHKAEMRAKILGVARRLFLNNGYQETTIRQITKLADVRTGSIYHFFDNKEDVFQQIAVEAFQRVAQRAERLVAPDAHLCRLACELTWHAYTMTAHPKATDLYLITYNSPKVAEAILELHLKRSAQFFTDQNPDLTELEHLARAMLLRSTMQSIALRAKSGITTPLDPLLEECFRLLFRGLHFSPDEIETALAHTRTLQLRELVAEALQNGGMMG